MERMNTMRYLREQGTRNKEQGHRASLFLVPDPLFLASEASKVSDVVRSIQRPARRDRAVAALLLS